MLRAFISLLTILAVSVAPAWAAAHGAAHAAGGGHGGVARVLPSQMVLVFDEVGTIGVVEAHSHVHDGAGHEVSGHEPPKGSQATPPENNVTSSADVTADEAIAKIPTQASTDHDGNCNSGPTRCCSASFVAGLACLGGADLSPVIVTADLGNARLGAPKPIWRSDGQRRPPRI